MVFSVIRAWTTIIVCMLGGLYMGIAGMSIVEVRQQEQLALDKPEKAVEFKGVSYYNPESFAARSQAEKISKLFPWAERFTDFGLLALTAGAFGVLGGMLRITKRVIIDHKQLAELPVVMTALFGFQIGLLILGVSYTLPAALTQSTDIKLRPATLIFLCFFGGVFAIRTYSSVESLFERIFRGSSPGRDGSRSCSEIDDEDWQ